MNPFEFVLAIIAIVSVVRIVRYRMGDRSAFEKPFMSRRDGRRRGLTSGHDEDDQGETMRLRDEVRQLKERLHVLERIAVDKENSLARQIDELREPRP